MDALFVPILCYAEFDVTVHVYPVIQFLIMLVSCYELLGIIVKYSSRIEAAKVIYTCLYLQPVYLFTCRIILPIFPVHICVNPCCHLNSQTYAVHLLYLEFAQ